MINANLMIVTALEDRRNSIVFEKAYSQALLLEEE